MYTICDICDMYTGGARGGLLHRLFGVRVGFEAKLLPFQKYVYIYIYVISHVMIYVCIVIMYREIQSSSKPSARPAFRRAVSSCWKNRSHRRQKTADYYYYDYD